MMMPLLTFKLHTYRKNQDNLRPILVVKVGKERSPKTSRRPWVVAPLREKDFAAFG